MKKAPLRVYTLIFCLALPFSSRADDALLGRTVESLLEFARASNADTAAMRFEADAADERILPAGALPDPMLRTEFRDMTRMGEQKATLAPSRVGSTRYLLMQTLPWYGKRALKEDVARHEAEVARSRADGAWIEIAARIKAAHVQRYTLDRVVRLAREELDLMSRLEKIARTRYAVGLAAQQDVIRAQLEQTAIRSELIQMENEGRQIQTRVNALLSRPADAFLAAPERLRALPAPAKLEYAALEERTRERNPELFAEEARIRAAEKQRDLTYKDRYPDFTLGVSPIQYQHAVREWEVMVEFNIPLQQTSRRAKEREAESMLGAARLRKEAASRRVLAELAENLSGIEAARHAESLVVSSLLPQAESTFLAALAAYETAKVDFSTLLEAQRQIRQARQSRLKAQAESLIRLAEVEKILGDDL
ncbi:MAG: TolC family protein [Candidatus Accumulibacter sp.]|jgi:outer membrane protein TolC|nr:TolC family protein [Accumulibacter sp.]